MREKARPLGGAVGPPWGSLALTSPVGAAPGRTCSSSSLLASFLQRTYIFTFLLSSRVFIPPHDLLARVGQICLEQRQQLETPGSEKVKVLMGATCLRAPSSWLAHS